MEMETRMELLEADAQSTNNRAALKGSADASCYCCIKSFPSTDIIDWVDYGRTAICPRCGVDAVVPGVVAVEKLQQFNRHWFGMSKT